MAQAAEQGVLLVSVGTIAQLGEPALSSTRQSLVHVCAFAHCAVTQRAAYVSVPCWYTWPI